MSKEDRHVLRLGAVLHNLKSLREETLETAFGLNNYFADQLRKILDLVSITPTVIPKAVITVDDDDDDDDGIYIAHFHMLNALNNTLRGT